MSEYSKKWYKNNREKILTKQRIYQKENRGKISLRQKDYYRNISRFREKERRLKWRDTCLFHYSNGKMSCNCCGESIKDFLGIDHENNDGAKHRKEIGGGSKLYKWLIDNNFPDGFQVLCHNCNLAKGFYGRCPHTLK